MEGWVCDQLFSILGLSNKDIAKYLIALAEKSSTSDGFVTKLRSTKTIDVNDSVAAFANELWNKIPRRSGGPTQNMNRLKEQYAIAQAKWNQSFQLLSGESSGDESKTKPAKAKNKHLRKRKKESSSSSSSEEERPKVKQEAESDDDLEVQERERLEDLKERDELSQRMKKKRIGTDPSYC